MCKTDRIVVGSADFKGLPNAQGEVEIGYGLGKEFEQALFRHTMSIMKGEYKDDGREFGHLEAIANNVMMLNYQLKTFYYEHRKKVKCIIKDW